MFTPTDAEVARARELDAAFAEHAAEGRSAFRFDGGMVDTPHLARAHRLLARARTTDPSPAAPSG